MNFELISKHSESFLPFSQFLALSIRSLREKHGCLDLVSLSSIAYNDFREMQKDLIATLIQEERSFLQDFTTKNPFPEKMKSPKRDDDFRVFLCKIRQKKVQENPNVEYLGVINEARSLWVRMSHDEKRQATLTEIS